LIIAMGLLQINNGIPSIHPGFRQFGVSSVVTEDANTVKVILSTPIINTIDVSSNNILMKPNMQISGTPEYPIIPLAGTFSPASTEPPFFRVRFSNGTTLLNLTGLNAYASFKLSY
jgi:hypothetical protein